MNSDSFVEKALAWACLLLAILILGIIIWGVIGTVVNNNSSAKRQQECITAYSYSNRSVQDIKSLCKVEN